MLFILTLYIFMLLIVVAILCFCHSIYAILAFFHFEIFCTFYCILFICYVLAVLLFCYFASAIFCYFYCFCYFSIFLFSQKLAIPAILFAILLFIFSLKCLLFLLFFYFNSCLTTQSIFGTVSIPLINNCLI